MTIAAYFSWVKVGLSQGSPVRAMELRVWELGTGSEFPDASPVRAPVFTYHPHLGSFFHSPMLPPPAFRP